ncbi:MAG: ANTAR domain-containing protein [Actinobacteria bacterium]|nr:ANTAR domain-containing protein [Actinomycetota bacterium]
MQDVPVHGDPLVPEDHEEIKREELLALEQEVNGLRAALGSRTVIGKAIGIIIEREGVNETQAFEVLKVMSQHSNVKLRDVAARLAKGAQPAGNEEP